MQIFNFAIVLALSFLFSVTFLGVSRWQRLGPGEFAGGDERGA